MFISFLLANTLALVVFEIMIRHTTISAAITAVMIIMSIFFMLTSTSANWVGLFTESTFSNVPICMVVSDIWLMSFTVILKVSGRGFSSA